MDVQFVLFDVFGHRLSKQRAETTKKMLNDVAPKTEVLFLRRPVINGRCPADWKRD